MSQSLVTIQHSLSAGELSPSLFGRLDLEKWHSGLSTCRNFFSNYRGGIMSRAGTAYVGTCKQTGTYPPRDISFQFSLNQGYVLEFGELYMRIKTNGAYITEAPKTITSVSVAGLFTATGHGLSPGDWIYDTGNTGFSGLTWIVNTTPTLNTFTVKNLFGTVVTSATASTSGTLARIYTVVSPYHAIDLPYLKYTQSADVMTLTCVNTGTGTEYPSYSLVRNGTTNWVFTQDSFAATIFPPTGLSASAQSSTVVSTYYSYVVTAVSDSTGEESVASAPVSIQNNDISVYSGSNYLTWNPVSGASSYNIYASTPSYTQNVPTSSLYGYVGTALGASFTDSNIVPDFTQVPPVHNDPFVRGEIQDVIVTGSGTNYSTSTLGYTINTTTGSGFSGTPVINGGKFVGFIINSGGSDYALSDTISFSDSGGGAATGNIAAAANPANGTIWTFNGVAVTFKTTASATYDIQIQATRALTMQSLTNFLNAQTNVSLAVAFYSAGTDRVNVTYKTPGSIGNSFTLAATIGTVSGATLTGGGTDGSAASATLVIGAETGTYPAVCAYYQQRRVYANSLNNPDTYWMSQPGLYKNFDSSIPVTSGDAIEGTPWAQQVNGIQWLVPMPGGLVTLTGKGAWQVNGGSSAAITPSNQLATPQAYNGSDEKVPPITINYDILYVQAKGSIIRDLSYNFFVNIYTGTDLTALSSHLFTGFQVNQWAWAEEPYKLIWVVRNDGTMLALTYLKEQEVTSWTRHDTNGYFMGVCTVTEPPVDAVYVITKRYIQGVWRYYSERMDNRIWSNVEDSFCVDAGLSTTLTYPGTTLNPSAAIGTNVPFITTDNYFSSGDVNKIIRVGGGIATVASFVSPKQVLCNITLPIVELIPNDPDGIPFPAQPGDWSISPTFTTFSGLNHLEGKVVSIVADGSYAGKQTVTNGAVTLAYPASLVKVGLPFTCQAQTLYVDGPPDKDGTAQNRRKLINSVGLRVEGTRGLCLGGDQVDASTQQNFASPAWTNMSEVKERTNMVSAGNAIPLFTGDYYKNISTGWSVKGQVAVQQSYPMPANILSVITYWDLGDSQ